MVPVVGYQEVAVLEGGHCAHGRGLLALTQVHEATGVTQGVLSRRGVLEFPK